MSQPPVTPADLRPVDLFDDLSDAELEPWAAVARWHTYAPGEFLAHADEEPPGVLFLLEGTVRTLLVQGGQIEPVARQFAPTWIYAIAVLTGGTVNVSMRAEDECRVAMIAPDDFRPLAMATPAVHRRVMSQVGPITRRITAAEQQRERMASLGEMAAGLAHELNNPAAAARRSAAQLAEAVEVVSASVGRFVEAGLEREGAAGLVELQREAVERASSRAAVDALDVADAEDALLERLEDLGVPEPWRVAEPLAAAGVDADWVERLQALAGPATGAAVAWVAATLTVQGLAVELQDSTDRLSTLVGAVKSYSYMDRGDVVEVDLHEGLETTLTVLGHKLKHTTIAVRRDYDRDLPRIMGRGSELNQVWTNLLDNAIDALGDAGTITITTRNEGDRAVVDIADDGPGVDPTVSSRIFDSFVTTKDVGAGTGLGLATARRIVVDRHDGSLDFDSHPGETVFHVNLPLGDG
ncbi:MAG TPA: ATP-binding protein [Solirubrobacteraceae bacterium]|nr:ATP-binding protein [Solirubrobacteraceae bacterium]